ncbi:hypothetical protein VNO77_37521 [Canavalia gladiata]|uniref:Uncharacterized protein n=1 Tax=Canavalia gladiata TaxID=3824 RepID=A0AAN9K8B0_CANGL
MVMIRWGKRGELSELFGTFLRSQKSGRRREEKGEKREERGVLEDSGNYDFKEQILRSRADLHKRECHVDESRLVQPHRRTLVLATQAFSQLGPFENEPRCINQSTPRKFHKDNTFPQRTRGTVMEGSAYSDVRGLHSHGAYSDSGCEGAPHVGAECNGHNISARKHQKKAPLTVKSYDPP